MAAHGVIHGVHHGAGHEGGLGVCHRIYHGVHHGDRAGVGLFVVTYFSEFPSRKKSSFSHLMSNASFSQQQMPQSGREATPQLHKMMREKKTRKFIKRFFRKFSGQVNVVLETMNFVKRKH